MRDREAIEREMYFAREDLEQNLSELKHVVRDKIDVKARAQKAMHEAKQQARMLAARGKDGVVRGYRAAVATTRERPVLVGSIAGGVLLLTAGLIYWNYRANRPWWKR